MSSESVLDKAGNVRSGEELDSNAVHQWLIANNIDLVGEPKITQYSGGASNWTYCLSYDNREIILRRAPAGTKAKGAHDMGREFKVLSGLNKGFTKVPKVYTYTENADIIGASFYIMEKIDGIGIRSGES